MFLNTIYTATPANSENAPRVANTATKPEIIAGYIRLFLTILGTVAGLLPALQVAGVPVGEWISTLLGATCQ